MVKKIVMSLLFSLCIMVSIFQMTASAVGNYGVDLSSAAYQTSVNPFFAAGFGGNSSDGYPGQCTWYAWGRAYEKLGVSLPCRGYADDWTDEAMTPMIASILRQRFFPIVTSLFLGISSIL